MDHEDEMELDREHMSGLDRAHIPSAGLEERIVAELRRRSLLRAAGEAPNRVAATHLRRARPWLAGAAAAVLAFVLGLRLGERQTVSATAAPPPVVIDSTEVAARIRAAAIDYVGALSAVRPGDAEARAIAIATFRTAADHMIRLAPQSDLAVAIGLAYPTSFVASPAVEAAAPARRVIWF